MRGPTAYIVTAAVTACGLAGAAPTVMAQQTQAMSGPPANQLNPGGASPFPGLAPDGLSLVSVVPRTPTGIAYALPRRPPDGRAIGTSGWLFSGFAEAGFIGQFGRNTDAASFREYGDFSEAPTLNRFILNFSRPGRGDYFIVEGIGAGRDDQAYQLRAGRRGKFDVRAFFNSTPHVFSTNARVLWNGAGRGTLTLPAGLTPGASTASAVKAAFTTIGQSKLALKREKSGLGLTYDYSTATRLFVNFSNEWRRGARPFGGAFTYPTLGQVTETVEPIDYKTYEISAGIRFKSPRQQANLTYSGSFFRNDIDSLTWENPGLSGFPVSFSPPRGRTALAPDNNYHRLRGDYAAALPTIKGTFSANAVYSRARQNTRLLAPTISSGRLDGPFGAIDLALWNTTAALSRQTAEAGFDTVSIRSRLTSAPARGWRLTANFRFTDQNNRTDYQALNPLTGEYGYIALDGGLGAIIPKRDGIFRPGVPGSRVRIRNVPFATDTLEAGVAIDYRLSRAARLRLEYRHKERDVAFRERRNVNDDRLTLRYSGSPLKALKLRMAYEYAKRSGDDYNFNPYEQAYSSSLPGFTPLFADGNAPHTLSDLRKFDLANRDQQAFDMKSTWVISERTDLSLSARYEDNDFDARFGLEFERSGSLNAEWNFRLDEATNLYAFYSYQGQKRAISNINDAGPVSSDAAAGGTVFPLANAWRQTVAEDNNSIGSGLSRSIGDFSFNLSYVFTRAQSRLRYSFANRAALEAVFGVDGVGNGFPDQVFRNHLVESTIRWQLRKGAALRLLYRFESESLNDFHYDGLTGPVVGNDIFLANVPENFSAHVVGVFLTLAL